MVVSLTVFAVSLLALDRLGQDFMPSYDRGEFQVSFKTNPGNTLEQTEEISNEIVRHIARSPGLTTRLPLSVPVPAPR